MKTIKPHTHIIHLVTISALLQACSARGASSAQQEVYIPQRTISTARPPLAPLIENGNSLRLTIPQLDLGQYPTIHLNNIHVLVVPNNLRMKPVGTSVLLESTDNSVEVKVDSISINEVIEKDYNGVIVKVLSQAECRGVTAQAHDANSLISLLMSKNPQNTNENKIENPKVEISAPEFLMTTQSCENGAQGFDELIEATIRNDLQNHELMSQLIKEKLIPMMTSWGQDGKKN